MTNPVASPAEFEPLALRDGGRLLVRPITSASKPVIAKAMTPLSPESIRRGFFTPRRELSDLDLERLTAMDGWNHYALGACSRSPEGSIEGVGIARFARLAHDPRAAEIAITVVDAYQGAISALR